VFTSGNLNNVLNNVHEWRETGARGGRRLSPSWSSLHLEIHYFRESLTPKLSRFQTEFRPQLTAPQLQQSINFENQNPKKIKYKKSWKGQKKGKKKEGKNKRGVVKKKKKKMH
jgi:hypothetical protein